MMKPEIEAALKSLMDMSGSAIRKRVLRSPEAPKVEIEIGSEEVQPEAEEMSASGELSEEDAALIEEALEQMGGQ